MDIKPEYIITFIAIFILISLAMREIYCWYFKINEIVIILKNIEQKLSGSNQNKL